MEKFKVSDWDTIPNDASSTFIKNNTINIINKKLIKPKKSKKAKKGVAKEIKSNPILKAKAKRNIKKIKDTSLKDTLKTIEKTTENTKNNRKSINKSGDVAPAVVFNRKTISNPILSSRKQNKTKSLRERMMETLNAARFRFLNEEIYVQDGNNAEKMFKKDPEAFSTYHTGYKQQIEKWPVNPLDIIIKDVKKMPKNYIIADLGCGEAKLSQSVPHNVHSFDLVALNDSVTACNMAATPLSVNSVDVVVFCLSLMGTNLHDYIREANRILKIEGLLKIAEVESRFDEIKTFIKGVEHFGFKKVQMNFSHNLFYFFDFKKVSKCSEATKLSTLSLKPCLYKKR